MPEATAGKKQANGRVSAADWAAARDEYVTGDKTYEQLARDLGVTKKAVEKHACDRSANGGRTWGEWRDEFQSEVSGQRAEIVKRIKVEAAATVSMKHAQILADLTEQALAAVPDLIKTIEDPRERAKFILSVIATERRVHGLDRVPVQVEVSGKDGGPIEHDVEHDFDDAGVAAAQRMLEAFFGPTQPAK